MPYEKIGKEVRCIADEVPFEIPDSWEWIHLQDVAHVNGGMAFKSVDFSQIGTRVIRISDFNENGFVNKKIVRHPYSEIYSPYLLEIKNIILCMTGGTVGKSLFIKELSEPMMTNQRVATIKIFGALEEYVNMVILSPMTQSVITDSKNSTNDNISMDTINKFWIPLPPLAEQKRIVAKIEELLPHIEEYGKAESKVSKLNAEFPEQLKKSILQWAIQGKLVSQNPDDEPASVLLERIRAEKAKLIKEGKIKKDKNESIIFRRDNSHYEKLDGVERCIDEEIPYELPQNWYWASIGSVFNLQAGKNIQASDIGDVSTGSDYPCYGGNGIRGYVPFSNHTGDYPIIGRQGALCGCINRATGTFYATEHAVCVDTFADTDVAWACYFLTALNLNQYATATAQPGLAVSNINHVLIPVPPLAEQKRIVAKIEELMPLVKTV